mmetsp:Transcript_390/g.897  ORF Transcript_390/g.897 Transcript_390/m.897 type:complete len:80 (-) Transcript_390:1390-1629(-)
MLTYVCLGGQQVAKQRRKPAARISDFTLSCIEVEVYALIATNSSPKFREIKEEILGEIFEIVKANGGALSFRDIVVVNK